jgi:hypothetical protein
MGDAQKETGMKFLVLILGSTTLVAGGTAITSPQDARNNVTAHQRPYQEHRAVSRGTDCQSVATPIFDNVAHPLVLQNSASCGNLWFGNDVDGDGVMETSECYFLRTSCEANSSNTVDLILHYVPGSNPPEVIVESFLDLNPDSMNYVGADGTAFDFSVYPVEISRRGYLDVTNDEKPDAIIQVKYQTDCGQGWPPLIQYFYIKNIFTSAACATDINNDGSTNVTDLLEVVGNWGACP